MFGKIIKNIFNKAEEAVDNIKESAQELSNQTENSNETQFHNSNIEIAESSILDPIEYRNRIVEINNDYSRYYQEFYQALYANDSYKINKAAENWKNACDNMMTKVKELGAFNGDHTIVIDIVDCIQREKDLIDSHFVKYAEANLANQENESELYEEAERKKSELIDEFNAILDRFNLQQDNKASDIAYLQEMQKQDALVEENAKDNPLLEPVHGISLYDYTAGVVKIGSGVAENVVFEALGIDKPQWDEAALIWNQRMEQDTQMTVMSLYGQYFTKVDEHPKLGANSTIQNQSAENPNLERLKTDEKYFYELSGERDAAVEVGKDGGQYILEKYGINILDFQSQAMIWSRSGNFHEMTNYQLSKKEEYLKKFQEESGGTIADDIEF